MSKTKLVMSLGTYSLLGFVPVATNLVVVPIYLRHLSVADYGRVGIANVALAFTQLIAALGMVEAYDRLFYENEANGGQRGALLGTTLSAMTVTFALVAGALALVGAFAYHAFFPSLEFGQFAWWILLSAAGSAIQALVFLSFRNRENLKLAATASLLPFFFGVGATLLAVVVEEGGALGAVRGRALGFLLGALIPLLALVRLDRLSFDSTRLRAMLAYGLPIVVYVLLNNVLFLGDRLLFERWATVELLGVYLLAVTVLSPADVLANAFGTALQPRLYRRMRDEPEIGWNELKRAYEALVAVEVVLLCIAITFATPVIRLIGKAGYASSDQFLTVLAFSQMFRLRYLYFSFPLFYFKRTRFLPTMTLGSIVVGFAFAALGFRLFGPRGIVLGVVAWKFSQQAIAHVYVRLSGISRSMGMPRSTLLTVLFGLVVVADAMWGVHARWVGALLLSLLATVFVVRELKGRNAVVPGG